MLLTVIQLTTRFRITSYFQVTVDFSNIKRDMDKTLKFICTPHGRSPALLARFKIPRG